MGNIWIVLLLHSCYSLTQHTLYIIRLKSYMHATCFCLTAALDRCILDRYHPHVSRPTFVFGIPDDGLKLNRNM
jgi:hypothetical protein